jgi:outer membrane immunogenic protein
MKRLALAISIIALGAATASAADLAPRPYAKAAPIVEAVFSWTGFYIGGNVGGHWGRDSITTTSNPVGFPPPTNADTLSPVTLKPQGVMGGFQVGYNWQMNNVVFGIEGDANWLGGTASRHFAYPFLPPFSPAFGDYIENSTSAAFLGTIRPRIGLTMDRLLLYVTGGVAFGSVKTTDSFCIQGCATPVGNLATVSGTTTRTGWTAGAGIEYAIGNNWSVKAEYLYVDLGSFNTLIPSAPNCVPPGACSFVVHHTYTDNIARLGVNYRFGGPVVARY